MIHKYKLGVLLRDFDEYKKLLFANILGIFIGKKYYTKFVILGRSRTGSNYLRSLLNSHSQILCYGEVFRDLDVAKSNVDTKDILMKKVYRKYPEEFLAVGFKLFYNHATRNGNDSLWKYLKEDKSVRIVHITRDNMLHTVLSRRVADITEQWAKKKETGKPNTTSLKLDYEDCLNDFEKTYKHESEARKMFSGHKVYEISYEKLSESTESVMEDICKFLRVQREDLVASTKKQSKKSLRESISNYDELKTKFKGSKWYRFFTE